MAFEIELKARLGNDEQVKEQLSTIGEYCRSYTKSDSYWLAQSTGVRVRRESGVDSHGTAYEAVTVTYKLKEIAGCVEVNDEREFTVSNSVLFEELLGRLGLHRGVCKEKQGWAWNVGPGTAGRPILAELSLVTGLGWFLELEIMADRNDPQMVEESRKSLLALLAQLEILEEAIETRPYTMMLLSAAQNQV